MKSMRLILSTLAVIPVLFLSSCTGLGNGGNSPKFRHVVVTWLKEHGNKEQQAKLIAAGRDLRSIPGVVSIEMGRCVPSERPIVDSTYDVAFIMTFKDETSMKQYVAHPKHQEVVKSVLKPLTKKVVVYDFVDE